MIYRYLLCLSIISAVFLSCNSTEEKIRDLPEMEFILVDSLVFDELQILRILDYHPEEEIFLMVNQGVEGRYFVVNTEGEVLAEEVLS